MADRTYPRHVHTRGGVYRVCEDAKTYQQARAEGWVDHPLLEWGPVDTYREWDGSPLVAEPLPPPGKRGRPKKVESL